MSAAMTKPSSTTTQAGLSSPHPAETHQRAADVAAALATGSRLGLGMTPFNYLPLFAQVAIERLNADEGLRNGAMLDELLQRYAEFYRMTVDIETCAAAHHICARRFWNFQASEAV